MIRKKIIKIFAYGKPSDSFTEIWDVVSEIPRGKVATYGEIAHLCGFPGKARFVGYALHNLPGNMKIPWHRVINSRGKISFPLSSPNNRLQKKLLQKEGVEFFGDTVAMERHRWLANNILK